MGLKQHFNREDLKQRIGEEGIFTHYFGAWDYGASYNSVFRKDESASTGFYQSKTGSIVYNDLRTGDKYDFVHFVMKKYALTYYAALKQIAVDFGLINGNPTNNKVVAIPAFKQAKKPLKKAFIINTSPYQKHHLDYWAQYGVTLEELKANRVYAVSSFTVNSFDERHNLITTFTSPQDNELRFVYQFHRDDVTYVKIYQPYNKLRFLGDVPLALPFGLDALPHVSKTLIVTKSVKDYIVLRKYFTDVIALQNESTAAFDPDILSSLNQQYENIIFWFDYDRPGLKAVNYFKKLGHKLAFTCCNKKNVWQNLIFIKQKQIKDPSDFVKAYGLDVFKKYLQYIKLI